MPFRFESTYKELKPEWLGYNSFEEIMSFESTYKELKLNFLPPFFPSLSGVLSLPIRNWNTVIPWYDINNKRKFWVYL